jgi:glutamine amidotransferase
MWHGIAQDERFYFVHSYCVEANRREDVAAETQYGRRFAAAIAHRNLFAVQFHPEKSHTAGLQLLANFMHWEGAC